MKKQQYFLVGIMLWMLSSVSFASAISTMDPMDSVFSITFTDSKITGNVTDTKSLAFTGTQADLNVVFANIPWLSAAFGPFGDFDGNTDGDDDDGNPGTDDGPAAVPLPSAVWLLGSALFGLAGFKRKPS
jgi:hypothetical protein